jgi:hypothetical protein
MTKFISWPISDDAAFRPAYAETTGELIQDAPILTGDFYSVGSSRITDEQATTLKSLFPDITITDEPNEALS